MYYLIITGIGESRFCAERLVPVVDLYLLVAYAIMIQFSSQALIKNYREGFVGREGNDSIHLLLLTLRNLYLLRTTISRRIRTIYGTSDLLSCGKRFHSVNSLIICSWRV